MKSPLSVVFLVFYLSLPLDVSVSATPKPDPPNTTPDAAHDIAIARPENAFLFDRFRLLAQAKSLSEIDTAYIDAWMVLKENDSCGKFYGRPEASLYVLNNMVSQLKRRPFPNPNLGIRMSGTVTTIYANGLQVAFRKFKSARINSWGAFYRDTNYTTKNPLSRIGRFQPNTREARALMLLHELAHLMKGADGNWLIPDDGNNPDLSASNTDTIAARCGGQISRLRNRNSRLMLLTYLAAFTGDTPTLQSK